MRPSSNVSSYFLVVACALWLGGCGGDTEVITQTSACVPGEAGACVCDGQRLGVQVCADDGTFGTCDCSGYTPPSDTGSADTGSADTGTADTGTADTGTPDTGTADTGTADTGGPTNECGGTAELAEFPGDPCGECNDGVLICSGADTLECIGATRPNACGTCSKTRHAVDEACGPCNQGS